MKSCGEKWSAKLPQVGFHDDDDDNEDDDYERHYKILDTKQLPISKRMLGSKVNEDDVPGAILPASNPSILQPIQ